MKTVAAFPALLLPFLVSCAQESAGTDATRRPASAKDTRPPRKATSEDALAIFKRRILPIMNSPMQSSCTECHLSGVELKDYIHSDQATTFAALRRDGLIDIKNPEKSKILTFIARKPKKPNPINEKIRQKELQAFRAWLNIAAKDPEVLKASTDDKTIGTKLPVEVIRHARKDRVLASFVDNVWSQMGRCISCHSPNRNQRLRKKFGEEISWIVPQNPQATLNNLVEAGNIDTDNPKYSPVLTKPAGIEKHGGGPKFLVGGDAYRRFLVFLKDYAAVVNGKYKAKKDLPKPQSELLLLTRQHLRIVGLPHKWNKLPMRVNIYHWDKANRRWSTDRWATAFSPINGKRHMWQSMISVTARPGSAREKQIRHQHVLPAGKYLARLYVDFDKKTRKNPNHEFGKREFIGQVEFHGKWPIGYRPPKIIRAPKSRD